MSQTLKTWLHILTHPSETTFKTELEKNSASWGRALTSFAAAVIVLALLNATSTFLMETLFSKFVGARDVSITHALELVGMAYDKEQVLLFVGSPLGGGLIALLSSLILAPLVLTTGIGLCFGLARLMGGNGSLKEHVYLFACFVSPIMILGGLSRFLPCVGLLLLITLWVFALILAYLAVEALHKLTAGKALTAVLLPYLILTVVLVASNPPSL